MRNTIVEKLEYLSRSTFHGYWRTTLSLLFDSRNAALTFDYIFVLDFLPYFLQCLRLVRFPLPSSFFYIFHFLANICLNLIKYLVFSHSIMIIHVTQNSPDMLRLVQCNFQ